MYVNPQMQKMYNFCTFYKKLYVKPQNAKDVYFLHFL